MTSVAALARRIDRMIEQIKPRIGVKTWEILCVTGQEIPDTIPIGPYDSVVIREYGIDYLDGGELVTVAWYEEGGLYYVPDPDHKGGYRKVEKY